MKVLHLCKYDFRTHNGGIESVCKSMYEYFKANAITNPDQFHYFLFFSAQPVSVQEEESQFCFYIAGTNYHLGSTSLSLSYIKKYNELCNHVDIIHVHVPNPVALLAIYNKKPKAKIIIHWHSDIVKQKMVYPLFKAVEQSVLRFTTAIIATSENYVQGSKPLAPYRNKITVIPIGIGPLTQVPASAEPGNGNETLIVSIGRLVYYKGFEYLIKAAACLPDNYRIVIIGNGVLKSKLDKMISNLQLQNKVTLAGKVSGDDLNTLMNNCKVFCLPSVERSEAFGVVLLEALSLGKPVVATNIPYSGVNWVNQNGVTGWNVEPKNEKQLAKAITALASDEHQYEKFCVNASNRFYELFTEDKMNNAINALYGKVMKSTSQPNIFT